MIFLVILLQVTLFIVIFTAIVRRTCCNSTQMRRSTRPTVLRVAIFHPDLGIGGAERLMVDAAVSLQQTKRAGPSCDVRIFTNFHDPKRAFEETVDGTLKPPIVVANWFPRHFRNKGHVFCATVRMLLAVLYFVLNYQTRLSSSFDVVFLDQVAAAMPLLRFLTPLTPLYFYCHFPDQLCDPTRLGADDESLRRRRLVHRAYRKLFDDLETWSMNSAQRIACNSKFSLENTIQTFPKLARRLDPSRDIVYPPVDFSKFRTEPQPNSPPTQLVDDFSKLTQGKFFDFVRSHTVVTSINRYEKKKNIELALRAVALALREKLFTGSSSKPSDIAVVICGGYDPRIPENESEYTKLRKLVADELSDVLYEYDGSTNTHVSETLAPVLFLRSVTAQCKYQLLTNSSTVIYTPPNEHFGIVPVEAMAFGIPVIAVSHGGPLESIGPGDACGLLRDDDPREFGFALSKSLDPDEGPRIGAAGRARAEKMFGFESFGLELLNSLLDLRYAMDRKRK